MLVLFVTEHLVSCSHCQANIPLVCYTENGVD